MHLKYSSNSGYVYNLLYAEAWNGVNQLRIVAKVPRADPPIQFALLLRRKGQFTVFVTKQYSSISPDSMVIELT